jgi:Putative beta-barrel porin-2, OmpL-like. bbp2
MKPNSLLVCASLMLSLLVASNFALANDAATKTAPPDATSGKAEVPAEPASATAAEPFAFADFTWLNGNSRQKYALLDSKYFTGQFNLDTNYIYDFANPSDHTLIGSTNAGRTNEVQVEQIGVGGDFHYENVHGRLMTQFGMYSTMTPRNDASPARGQWDLSDAYRYVSEAYAGYHWDIWNGINLDAGIFMSYIGLESYYNFENWNYQMSYVSANTPWFFNGLRLQMFPSDKLKVELWFINGWQSYGQFNQAPGVGWQILWRPNGNFSFVSNEYFGHDTLGLPSRMRFHSDTSAQYKYYDHPEKTMDKMAFSVTFDAGCENGAGVQCLTSAPNDPAQNFVGIMAYQRFWFKNDTFGLTVGGGAITNPGRYLVLLPPINGATASTQASSTAQTSFTENPGDQFKAWDSSITLQYMPSQFITWDVEFDHRQANVPYFAGQGGITPPGGNQAPIGGNVPGFTPDLETTENRINLAMIVRL